MSKEIVTWEQRETVTSDRFEPPAIVREAGGNARFAYDEFFRAEIDNDHTRRAYRHAVNRFLIWTEGRGLALQQISPSVVGEYLRQLTTAKGPPASKPTRKLHLAAIRHFFDRLVIRHAVVLNPAASVRGPRYQATEGKTPCLSVQQARAVLGAIDTRRLVGLRDRAIIGILVYTAARVGAVSKLRLADFYPDGNQWMLHLTEKGGKDRRIPCRHDLQGYLEQYIAAAGPAVAGGKSPVFRTATGRTNALTDSQMTANDILRMVKRRFADAGLPAGHLTCHSFRATTITDLLDQGVPLEDVQYLAGHADPRTTRLYDRRRRQVTRNIVERISI